MNNRIEQMMADASGGACYDGNQLALYGEDIKKFAELIVRECAGVCDDERDSTDSEFGKLVAEGCALKIIERFGVEE